MKKIILLALVALSSCTKDEPLIVFDVSAREVELSNQAAIMLQSNSQWEAQSTANWLSIEPAIGFGNAQINFVPEPYIGKENRYATVQFTQNGAVIQVEVMQQASPDTLMLDYTELAIEKQGGNDTIIILSNTAWTATSNANWITLSANSGSGSGEIIINTKNNSTDTIRNATISFEHSKGVTTLHLTQYSTAYTLATVHKDIEGSTWVITDKEGTREEFANLLRAIDSQRNDIHLVFPNLIDIPLGAFNHWIDGNRLERLYAPKVISVGKAAFNNVNIQHIDLPAAKVIGYAAFFDCDYLETVNIPSVEIIGNNAFDRGGMNIRHIDAPKLHTLGSEAFSGSGLNSINAPNLRTVGDDAFLHTALTEVNFPNVLSLGAGAFSGCSSLHTAILPKVNRLNSRAFSGTSLSQLTIATQSNFIVISSAVGDEFGESTVFPSSLISNINLTTSLGSTSDAKNWNIYGATIGEFKSVTVIQ